jgi:hypothetical protein
MDNAVEESDLGVYIYSYAHSIRLSFIRRIHERPSPLIIILHKGHRDIILHASAPNNP